MAISWPVWTVAAAVAGAGNLAVHLVYAALSLRRFEDRPAFQVTPPPQDGPLAEPIGIPTDSGLWLSGGVYLPTQSDPRGVVIFCPETDGDFPTALNYAGALLEAGFAVLSFSFRNQGDSDVLPGYRSTHWVTEHEIQDVHAAIEFVQAAPQFDGLPIGLMGVSRGAGAALAAAAQRPEIQAVWSQGAFSTQRMVEHYAKRWIDTVVGRGAGLIPDWHVRVTLWFMLRMAERKQGARIVSLDALLPRLADRSVQFVGGKRDTYVPPVLTQQLCRRAGHAPQEDCWIVPQAKHNQERAVDPVAYDARLVKFFQNALQSPAPSIESNVLAEPDFV